jgi:PAS domain-containing protein
MKGLEDDVGKAERNC